MSDQALTPRPDLMLTAIAGGYLRNPVREKLVTCADCLTPVNGGFERCFACNAHRKRVGLADRTAFLSYAIAGRESGHVMRGYKAQPPVAEHRLVVGLLLLLALQDHTKCASAIAGRRVTHWAIVPSLPAKPSEHPLRGLVVQRAHGSEAPLKAAAVVGQPRSIDLGHFTCSAALPPRSHVLLIDDTWTTGGHAQSAALAFRKAGAAEVSVLVVARWLKEEYADNKRFIAKLDKKDYEPLACPWTSGTCPA